jgi:hypothetical protein
LKEIIGKVSDQRQAELKAVIFSFWKAWICFDIFWIFLDFLHHRWRWTKTGRKNTVTEEK